MAQLSSEIPEGLMNNPIYIYMCVCVCVCIYRYVGHIYIYIYCNTMHGTLNLKKCSSEVTLHCGENLIIFSRRNCSHVCVSGRHNNYCTLVI
jgi:hypothetical protein